MNYRFYFTVLLCAGMGVCPMQTGAQHGHKIDLRHLVAPPFATANTPARAPTVEQTAHVRIIQRRLQYRQRRAALRHVVRLRFFLTGLPQTLREFPSFALPASAGHLRNRGCGRR